jgi:hypothetical protein
MVRDHFPLELLEYVSSLVPAEDSGVWRLTCRAVRQSAEAFRFRHVRVVSPAQLSQLCESIERTPRCRRHMVRLICCLNPAYGVASLNRLVRAAGRVQRVDVHGPVCSVGGYADGYGFLEYGPQLEGQLHALLGLPQIQHLTFNKLDVRPQHCALFIDHFTHLRPALRSLTLDLAFESLDCTEAMRLLESSAATLEFCEMRNTRLGPWDGPSAMPVFPRVHTLRLWDVQELCARTLMDAFPSVRRLSVVYWSSGPATVAPGWSFEDAPCPADRGSKPWTEFDELHVSPRTLQDMGLHDVHASHLAIANRSPSSGSMEDMLTRVSADLLCVSIWLDAQFCAIPFPRAAGTVILEIRVSIASTSCDIPAPGQLTALVCILP